MKGLKKQYFIIIIATQQRLHCSFLKIYNTFE